MAYQFTIIIIKPTRGGYGQEVADVTALRMANARYWNFQPVAEDQDKPSTFRIRHKANLPFLDIQAGYRWCAGWRDRASGTWDGSRELYAGYIQKLGNGGQGQLKHLNVTGTGFSCLLTRTLVQSWPDPNDFFALYPLGYSAAQWFAGSLADGAPYEGVVRERLSGYAIDWSGIDPEFNNVIFGWGADGFLYKPGKSISESPARGGSYRYIFLDEAVDDILEEIRIVRPDMDPVAWFEPTVNPSNPTEIIPKFRVRDRNNTNAAPVATYATHPVAGEWQIENPAEHERDWTEVAGRVIVKSAGFELVDGVLQVKAAVGYDETKASRYQTTWQAADSDGWADLIRDETIPTIAECQVLADTQLNYRWGAQGRMSLRSTHFVPAGSNILVNWPEEGQNYALHRVTDITLVPNLGRPMYDIQLGSRKPDLADIFQRQARGLTRIWTLQQAGQLPGGSNGAPQGRALNTSPTHDGQNVVQAADDHTTALTLGAGYVPPGDTRTPEVINRLNVPAPDGTAGTSVSDHDGRPHPQTFMLAFAADGTSDPYIGHWDMDVSVIRLKGTGTCTLNKNGVAVAGPFTSPGMFTFAPVHYSVADPTDPDDWSVTVSGVSGSLSATVSEA